MAKVWCCRRFQPAEVINIAPTKSSISDEFVFYNPSCSFCGKPILEIIRIDETGLVLNPVRLKTKNIHSFIEKINVLFKKKKSFKPKSKISKFVLGYNEYGKMKKCYANLSNLSLGKIELNPYNNLKNLKSF